MIKQIKDHPKYAVSDRGEVYIIERDGLKPLKKDISIDYARVQLDGSNHYVASLVAEYFIKEPEDKSYKIFYIDGDKSNCDVKNLVWLSKSDIQRYSQCTIEYRKQVLGIF